MHLPPHPPRECRSGPPVRPKLLRGRLSAQPSDPMTRKPQRSHWTTHPFAEATKAGGRGVRSVHATNAEACNLPAELLHRSGRRTQRASPLRPPTSAYTRAGFGRKGPWMSLEIFDQGRQKPTPVMGDPVLPARTMIQKVVPGSEGPRDHRSTLWGSSMLKRAKYSPIGACPSTARVRRATRAGGSRLTADNHVPPERDDGFRVLPLVSLILRNCLPA